MTQFSLPVKNQGPLLTQEDYKRAIADLYTQLRTIVNALNAETIPAPEFSAILDKPTTLAGYGITDAAHLHHTHPISDIIDLQHQLDELFAAESGGGSTVAWTAITGKPTTFPPPLNFYDGRFYIQSVVDALLAGKAPLVHNHDTLYYRKAVVDTLLAGKVARFGGDYFTGFDVQPTTLTFDMATDPDTILRVIGPFDLNATLDVGGIFEVAE